MTIPGRKHDVSLERQIWKNFGIFGRIRDLYDAGPNMPSDAAILKRLHRSKHVADLWIALLLTLLALVVFIIVTLIVYLPHGKPLAKLERIYLSIVPFLGVVGIILGWIYRTASNRLGIVDLFAYEITTLCRVGTIVDVISTYIKAFQMDQTERDIRSTGAQEATINPPHRFVSQESYFPIFESNSRDLRILEAGVVTNVTAFYTFMKVVRDYLRRIGDLDAVPRNKQLTNNRTSARAS
jgi:hypothetical protein